MPAAPPHPAAGPPAVGSSADEARRLLEALRADGGPLLAGLPAPRRADGVELLGTMAGSGHRRAPGLARRPDGQTLQLTALLYALLEQVDGCRTYADIAAELGQRLDREVTAADVAFLAEARLRPLGVLANDDGSTPRGTTANPLLGLRCKIVVSDPERTRRLTAPFARLFSPLVVAPVVTAFAALTGWLAFDKGLASALHEALYSPHLLLLVFALTVVSAGFHEFGHAAACRYGGATPGAMGAGLYLVWPAFYTDVSDSYRLGRAGRLRVDLGGLYFNAVFAVGVFGVWAVVGWDALLLVVGTQILQMLRQLTPLVRFDGYHILADLTGVPDLFAQIKPTLLGLLPSRWGRPETRVLKPWARAVVTLWVLVVVPLLVGLLVLAVALLPRLAATAADSFALHWAALAENWVRQDAARIGVGLLGIASLALPLAALVYLLVRIGRRVARAAWRAAGDRPLPRAGVVLAAAALLGGVGWLWASHEGGPIEGTEGGRLQDAFAGVLPPADDEDDDPAPDVGLDPWQATAREAAPNRTVAAAGRGGALPVDGGDRGAPPTSSPTASALPQGPGLPAPQGPGLAPPAPAAEEPVAAPVRTVAAPRPTPPPRERPPREQPWPFPFPQPGPAGPGDNRAYAVNTTDGTAVSDVAISLVRTSTSPVVNRNEAWALAHCTDCRARAVAFHVVLIESDDVRVVTPVNQAVSVNDTCTRCESHGVAVQLVATLTGPLDGATLGRITAAMAPLNQLRGRALQLPLADIYASLHATRAEILAILAAAAPDAEISEDLDVSDEAAEELAEEGLAEAGPDGGDLPDGSPVEQSAGDAPDATAAAGALEKPTAAGTDDPDAGDAAAVPSGTGAAATSADAGGEPPAHPADPAPTPAPAPPVHPEPAAIVHEDDGESAAAGRPPVADDDDTSLAEPDPAAPPTA